MFMYKSTLLQWVVIALVTVSSYALASDIHMPKEQWLTNLKPIMSKELCAKNSPFLPIYKEEQIGCSATVGALFVKCRTDVSDLVLPDILISVEQANRYGSIMAECISAHYMGGDALKIFITIQNVRNSRATRIRQ